MTVRRPPLRPLRHGEDFARTNPDLLKALKVTTHEEALQKMKELLESLKEEKRCPPKRDRKGAPHASTVLLEAAGLSLAGIPEIISLLCMKRVLGELRDNKTGIARLNRELRARQMLKQKNLGGWPNPFCLLKFADRDTINKYAKKFTESARPKRFDGAYDKSARKMEVQFPRWRRFEPFLLELLPISLQAYVEASAGSELWVDLFNKCERQYELLDQRGPQLTSSDTQPSVKLIFYVVNIEGLVTETLIMSQLPSRETIAKLTSGDDFIAEIIFDWIIPVENDTIIEFPRWLTNRLGPSKLVSFGQHQVIRLPHNRRHSANEDLGLVSGNA